MKRGKRARKTSYKKVVLSAPGQRDMKLVAAGRLVSALFIAATLISTAQIVGQYAGGETISPAQWIAPSGFALMAGIGAFFEIWYGGYSARKEEKRIRHRLLSTVLSLSGRPSENEAASDAGKTIALMTDNAERVTEYRQVYFGATLAAMAIPFLTLTYVALAIDQVVGLSLMVLCPLIPILIGAFMSLFRKTSANSRKERGKLSGQYLDAIRNLVTIRLLGAGPRIEKHLREQGERNRGAIMKLLAGNQIVIIVMDGLFSLLLICCAAFLTVGRFHAGALSLWQAVAIMFLTVLLIEPLVQVAGFFYIGMGGMASERAIGSFLSESSKKNSEPSNATKLTTTSAISTRNLSFDYGRGEVLRDIHLDVPRGSKAAIVGRSGGGKSTLLALLRGALPIQKGGINVDGQDLSSLSLQQAHLVSASVAQSTWLFTGTIADNLKMARPNGTEEDMWRALTQAQVADEIRRMPAGIDTYVGEQGVLISGGQAQRISLARAFLSGRKVLILDEPTSQVDIESEEKIIAAIAALDETWTVLMVTHRRSLLAIADSVWHMQGGTLSLAEGAVK